MYSAGLVMWEIARRTRTGEKKVIFFRYHLFGNLQQACFFGQLKNQQTILYTMNSTMAIKKVIFFAIIHLERIQNMIK